MISLCPSLIRDSTTKTNKKINIIIIIIIIEGITGSRKSFFK